MAGVSTDELLDELSVYTDELLAYGDPRGELLARLSHPESRAPPSASARRLRPRDAARLELGVEAGAPLTLRFIDQGASLGPRFVLLAAALARLPGAHRLRAVQLDACDCQRNMQLLEQLGHRDTQLRPAVLVIGPGPRAVRTYASACPSSPV